MNKAQSLLNKLKEFAEAKDVQFRGIRLDSIGVYIKPGPASKFRTGPKQIDVTVDMQGFQDPDNKVKWRHTKFEVPDPLDLSADAPAKADIKDAMLKAAKAFDDAFESEMAGLGFNKEK